MINFLLLLTYSKLQNNGNISCLKCDFVNVEKCKFQSNIYSILAEQHFKEIARFKSQFLDMDVQYTNMVQPISTHLDVAL